MPQSDTQADLTERARGLIQSFDGQRLDSADISQDSAWNVLLEEIAAFAQSEREAAAAEARRAAIERLEALRDGKLTDVPGCNDKWTLDNAIKALASPPAPQEETPR